ncbi:MAG TPA: polysaccharide biosynthesis C-terminal domain-containing protein [Flavisolibacter sp.]
MVNLVAKVFDGFRTEFFSDIIRRTAKIVSINITAAVLLFAANYFIIRFFGESNYGAYVIINVWVGFFVTVILFGMDDFFVAQMPRHQGQPAAIVVFKSIFTWSLRTCLVIFGVVVAVFAGLAYFNVTSGVIFQYRYYLPALAAALGLLTFLVAFLRGMDRIIPGQLVDKILRPSLFLAGITAVYFLSTTSLETLLLVQLAGILACVPVLLLFIRPVLRSTGGSTLFDRSGRSNVVFLAISLLYLLSTRLDLFFLAVTIPADEVGHYNIAARIADFVAYPLTALNLLIPNLLSSAYHQERTSVRSLIRRLFLLTAGVMAVGFVFILLFGKIILSFFGENFESSYVPLLILAGGHMFTAAGAPLNALFMVSGRQKLSLLSLGFGVLVTFVLCLVLVPSMGAVGAALAIAGGGVAFFIGVFYSYLKSAGS